MFYKVTGKRFKELLDVFFDEKVKAHEAAMKLARKLTKRKKPRWYDSNGSSSQYGGISAIEFPKHPGKEWKSIRDGFYTPSKRYGQHIKEQIGALPKASLEPVVKAIAWPKDGLWSGDRWLPVPSFVKTKDESYYMYVSDRYYDQYQPPKGITEITAQVYMKVTGHKYKDPKRQCYK